VLLVHGVAYFLGFSPVSGKEAAVIHVPFVEGNTVIFQGSVLQAVHERDGKDTGYTAPHRETTDLSVSLFIENKVSVGEYHFEDRHNVSGFDRQHNVTMAAEVVEDSLDGITGWHRGVEGIDVEANRVRVGSKDVRRHLVDGFHEIVTARKVCGESFK